MPRVLLASLAAGDPMGQQAYETEITAALRAVVGGDAVTVATRAVRSWRSTLEADVRLPLSVLHVAPLFVQRLAGRRAYGRCDLVHRLDLRLPPARREVVTVHDVAPLRFPDEGTLPRHVSEALARSRAVICPSTFAAREVRDAFGVAEPVVIPNGVPDDVWQASPLTPADRQALGVPDKYLLQAGGATQRKNLAGLAGAWQQVRQTHPDTGLVLCGPPDGRRDRLFADMPGVHLLGKVPRGQLISLMSAAAAVVVPSTYEGFGLPALEAMACGTPVVAARAASLPEVCGDAALLVDPTPDGLAKGMAAVLTDDPLVQRLRAAGPARARQFSWESAARQHLEVYLRALQDR